MYYSSEETQKNDPFPKSVGISFALHMLILFFFVVKAAFFTDEPIDFTQAIRVDVVGLPSKLERQEPVHRTAENFQNEKELPPKQTQHEKAVEKAVMSPTPTVVAKNNLKMNKNKEEISLDKSKSRQQSAIEKLKSLAALEKIEEDEARERIEKSMNSAKGKTSNSKINGNILSPGTALTGLAKLQHDNYAADLDRHIKERWALPEWLANRDLKAQAKVYFDRNGNIVSRKIIKSSGNQNYDEEVLATIDRSAPFPPPPEKFVSIVEVDGILIGFPE